jgi:hypothetical protein
LRANSSFLFFRGHSSPRWVDHQRLEVDRLFLRSRDRLRIDEAAVEILGAG